MLDPGLIRDPAAINAVRDRARDSDSIPSTATMWASSPVASCTY